MNMLQQAEETLKLDYELLKKYDELLQKYNKAVEELVNELLRTREAKLSTKVDGLQLRIVS